MKEIIFATGNAHKVYEVQQMIPEDTLVIKSLKDINFTDDIVEDGDTMHANALIKAETIFKLEGRPVFAEDSGLEVLSLNNEPGLFTARYAGPARNHDDNMDLVLKNLEPHEDRTAQFRAVIAYIDKDEVQYFEGIIKGKIAMEKSGGKGFGYDPIFIPDGYEETFALLGDDIKNKVSHRSKAMKGFMEFLNTKFA